MTQRNHDASWAEPGLYEAIATKPATSGCYNPSGCRPIAIGLSAQQALGVLARFQQDARRMPPVIRASGGRCDITRCVPVPARDFARFCAGRPSAHAGRRAGEADCNRRARRRSPARHCAGAHRQRRPRHCQGASWPTIWRRSPRTGMPAARWRALLDREIDALDGAGLIAAAGSASRRARPASPAPPSSSGSRATCRAPGTTCSTCA